MKPRRVTWPGITWTQVHEQYPYANQFIWLEFMYSFLRGESFKIWSDWIMFKNRSFLSLWNEILWYLVCMDPCPCNTVFLWSTNSLNTFLFISLLTDCTAHTLCYYYYCIITTSVQKFSKFPILFAGSIWCGCIWLTVLSQLS